MSSHESNGAPARRDSDERKPRPDEGVVRRRIGAFLADTALVVGVCDAVSSRTASTTRRRVALTAAIASTLGFLYHVALEGRFGQTVGKRWFGVVVVSGDGRPCTYRAAFVRTAGRLVDALPVGYLVGLAAILLTPRDQRLGDLLAGTVVVRAGAGDPVTAETGDE